MMNIFNRDIDEISFSDIESFCDEKQVEGIQLEYKKEFPKKGLAKQIASFSNTRGGLIIIGIEEDEKIGIPISWNGVENNGKLLERVHQYASQVEPIPSYNVTNTNEKNGKVFILLRVFEGENTPYFVQNDSNIWVRTGNISNPIDHVSPDALELLYRKREKAEKFRNIQHDRKNEIANASLDRQEKRRLIAISSQDTEEESQISTYKVGSNVSMCEITIQPFYPKKSYLNPYDLKNSLSSLKSHFYYYEFPDCFRLETTHYGVLSFFWKSTSGFVQVEQIFGNGLISNSRDISSIDKNGSKSISLTWATILLYSTLLFGAKYFCHIGYQGNLVGYIKLSETKGAIIRPVIPEGWHTPAFFEYHTGLLDEYIWGINTDTAKISNVNCLKAIFQKILDSVYMSFNYSPPGEKLYDAFLK